MITRFDHAVIAVRDLEAAVERFTRLGFDVHRGGRHTGLGTYNAIVRFGLDYLELLAVADREEAIAGGAAGSELVAFLDRHEGGLVGYAVATDDIEADARRFAATGLDAVGPFPMERRRPDGRVLSWRLLVPGGVPWVRPWPFLIQWDVPDDERLSWERPGTHANGAIGVAGVAVAVADLDWGIELYRDKLGLSFQAVDEVADLAARRARFSLGTFVVDVLAPTGPGEIQAAVDTSGEKPFEVVLRSADLERTRRALADSGIAVEPARGRTGLSLPEQVSLGARLTFASAA